MAPLLLFAFSILLLITALIKWTSQRKNISEAAALSRTPNNSPVLDQLDDFWRECLQSNAYDQTKYTDLLKRLQALVAHLPQAEQDKFFMPFVTRNAEYIAIAKRDKGALKVRLGLPG